MAKSGGGLAAFMAVAAFFLVVVAAADERRPKEASMSSSSGKGPTTTYTHTWPAIEAGWRVALGSVMAFFGAAFGSVGGVGGGGIFVPMLTLVIGFDTKSSAAISKCMIVGAAASTVYYNVRKRHPKLDMPIIDYDLALLFQPMLMLGISIGVTFNVIFADGLVTVVLIILCLATSTKAFFKGIEKWKEETIQKEADLRVTPIELDVPKTANELDKHKITDELENQSLLGESSKHSKVSLIKNVQWGQLGVIFCVWIAILTLQILKRYTFNCSTMYWVYNLLQIPMVVAASGYEALMLYKGKRVITSQGEKGTNFKRRQLVFYCFIGVVAGAIGGLVGLGGGVILGPLFLEIGVPPQVSSATATFIMLFSSSMSVVEYYILRRFPIPYTLYFVGVTTIAALAGQHIAKKVIALLRRASIIIFILAFTVFISAFFIGGERIVQMVHKIDHHKYMRFESLCSNHS